MITTGSRVAVRDAFGHWLEKVAAGPREPSRDGGLVMVRWPDGDEAVGWPSDCVVPYEEAPDAVLSHAEYLAFMESRRA